MSSADAATAAGAEEDLIDYEEDAPEATSSLAAPAPIATNGDAAPGESKSLNSYVGVHSTGFRDFLLKPELLRAISDLGFEHPSEGTLVHPARARARARFVRVTGQAAHMQPPRRTHSPAGVHPPGHPRHGRSLPGQVWNGYVDLRAVGPCVFRALTRPPPCRQDGSLRLGDPPAD